MKFIFKILILLLGISHIYSIEVSDIDTSNISTSIRVRISSQNNVAKRKYLKNSGFDVIEQQDAKNNFDLIVSPKQFKEIINKSWDISIVDIGRPLRKKYLNNNSKNFIAPHASMPDYKDLDQIDSVLTKVQSDFPNLAKVVDLTDTYQSPTTVEGRHLKALKISDNVDQNEDEFSVLIVSAHHSREIVTPEIALYAIDRLTSLYSSDPSIKQLVDNNEIWIAPIWNPDGYNHVFTSDNMWRKNRKVFSQAIGVDLNRNYPIGWDDCGGSTDPNSESFKGLTSASEAETQTMINFSQTERFIKVLDFHSFGEFVIYGYSACSPHPFENWYETQASDLGNAAGYNRVVNPGNMGLHYQWQINQGAWSVTVETETAFGPSYAAAQAEAIQVWPSVKFFLENPISIYGHVKDTQGNPLSANININGINFNRGENFKSGGPFGRYQFMLPPGTYQFTFSLIGYESKDSSVTITDNFSQLVDIVLLKNGELSTDLKSSKAIYFMHHKINHSTKSIFIYSMGGNFIQSLNIIEEKVSPWNIRDIHGILVPSGVYFFTTDLGQSKKFILPLN